MSENKYDKLKAELQEWKRQGQLDPWPDTAERADWAYGNTKLENPDVTREMAVEAAARTPGRPPS